MFNFIYNNRPAGIIWSEFCRGERQGGRRTDRHVTHVRDSVEE